ncbi:hypothetical protein CYMTET_34724, partial [Cymbomonas tetramitiformis]
SMFSPRSLAQLLWPGAEELRREKDMQERTKRLDLEARKLKENNKKGNKELQDFLRKQMDEKRERGMEAKSERNAPMDRPLLPAETSVRGGNQDQHMRKTQYRMELQDQMWEREFEKYMESEKERLQREQYLAMVEDQLYDETQQKKLEKQQQEEDLRAAWDNQAKNRR